MIARRAAPAALLAAVLSACLSLRPPDVRLEGLAVRSASSRGLDLDVSLAVTNGNRYRLGVRELTYRLSIDGAPAGEGSIPSSVSIPPHETASVSLPLTVDFAPVKARALEMALTGGIDYAIEGEAVFTTPLGPVRRPYRHEGRLPLYR